MVFLALILLVVIFFVAVSIFDKNLRDKIVEGLKDVTNKIFTSLPPALDKIVTDPLQNQISKLRAGRDTGGIELNL